MGSENEGFRWVIVPFVAVTVFVVTAIVGFGLCLLFGLWFEPVIGFMAAFSTVLITSLSAPKFEEWVGVLTYFLGAVAAWYLIGDSFYPENYAQPYEPTNIPIVVTYLGGLLGVALCFFLKRI